MAINQIPKVLRDFRRLDRGQTIVAVLEEDAVGATIMYWENGGHNRPRGSIRYLAPAKGRLTKVKRQPVRLR
jgi:hypothetical protein